MLVTGAGPIGLLAMKVALALILAARTLAAVAQTPSSEWNVPKPGVKEVQVSFASLKPSATIKIGGTADWALVTDDAVWVASTKPYAVLRIDPSTNRRAQGRSSSRNIGRPRSWPDRCSGAHAVR